MLRFLLSLGALAAVGAAVDLPTPRYECGPAAFGPIKFGPITCAVNNVPGFTRGTDIYNIVVHPVDGQGDCKPVFCADNTLIEVCMVNRQPIDDMTWDTLYPIIAKGFDACGGRSKNPDGSNQDPDWSQANVYVSKPRDSRGPPGYAAYASADLMQTRMFNPFSYIGKDRIVHVKATGADNSPEAFKATAPCPATPSNYNCAYGHKKPK